MRKFTRVRLKSKRPMRRKLVRKSSSWQRTVPSAIRRQHTNTPVTRPLGASRTSTKTTSTRRVEMTLTEYNAQLWHNAALSMYTLNCSISTIANACAISTRTVYRWLNRAQPGIFARRKG